MTDERPGPALEAETRALVAVSAALAARDDDGLERALERAREEADPRAVEEALLQSYLFLGYPVALDGFDRWREISGREAPGPSPAEWDAWGERGRRVCQVIYGDQYERLRENVRHLHPEMERWMLTEGYGKVLGRPGLALPARELCVVALLAVQRSPVQLYSHLRGALNAGASADAVDEALRVASGYMDDGGRSAARSTWERVRARVAER